MDSFDQLWIWDGPAMSWPLDWYRAVAANCRPAKVRIATTVPLASSPEAAAEDVLRAELERARAWELMWR